MSGEYSLLLWCFLPVTVAVTLPVQPAVRVFRKQTSPTAECNFHFECSSGLFEFPGVLRIPDVCCTWNLATFYSEFDHVTTVHPLSLASAYIYINYRYFEAFYCLRSTRVNPPLRVLCHLKHCYFKSPSTHNYNFQTFLPTGLYCSYILSERWHWK